MTPELEQLLIDTALSILSDDDANPEVGMGMTIGTAVEMAIENINSVSKVLGRGDLSVDAQAITDKVYAIKYPGISFEEQRVRREALPRMRVQIELEGNGIEGLQMAESFLMMADYPPQYGALCGSYDDSVLDVHCSWRFIKEKGI